MLKKRWLKITVITISVILVVLLTLMGVLHLFQYKVTHINNPFVPIEEYKKVELTPETDLKTIFLQTGIAQNTAKKMIKDGRFDEILKAQEDFFANDEIICRSLIDWLTREDRLKNIKYDFYDLQPGDILVTLSTHSLGWRHGHCAIVVDKFSVVESISLGVNSSEESIYFWKDYPTVAVLRVKNKTAAQREAVAKFAAEKLIDKPYSIFAGFGSEKAVDINGDLVLHCSYLPWYAWQYFGVDLDSDGGPLVTSDDILNSDKVEIIQIYGMDPREFLN
jgi:uncharacterized protein YycO